jgi:hypothetical protein
MAYAAWLLLSFGGAAPRETLAQVENADLSSAPGLLSDPARDQMPAVLEQAQAEYDQALTLLADRPDRARELFRSAAARFESIAGGGVKNGYLEFNLGNCCLHAGDVGRAILHYRRAQRFIPRDAQLLNNLQIARKRCLTPIPTSRAGAILRSIFFWHFETAAAGRVRFAMLMYVLVWLAMIGRTLLPRRWSTVTASAAAVMCVAAASSAGLSHWSERNVPEGVVLSMDVAAHNGPGHGYQRQFEQPLQAGTEFSLRQRRQGWWEIELPDGKRGWIEAVHGELIPPTAP